MIRLAVMLLLLARASAAFTADAEPPRCNALRQGGVDDLMRTVPGHDLKCHVYGMKLVRDSTGHDARLLEAERIFDTLLRMRPQSPFAFIGYAEIKMRKRELGLFSEDSLDVLHTEAERATRIKPLFPDSYVTLGRADLVIGCLPCAEKSASKAEELGVNGPDLKLLQSSIAEGKGKTGEARDHLREALANPSLSADRRSQLHLALAELHVRTRHLDEADREFQDAASANPMNILAHTRRAEVLLFERGNVKAALEVVIGNKRAATTMEARRIRSLADYFVWSQQHLEGRDTPDIKNVAQVAYVSPEAAFITCARYPGLAGLFESLLKAGVVKNLEERDGQGNTALLAAAAGNNGDTIRLLVARGANVNAQNERGERALSFLTRNGNHAVMKLVLEAGANVHYADRDGRSPLMFAVLKRDSVAVRELLRYGTAGEIRALPATADLLSAAAMMDDVETTRLLLGAGIGVNSTDRHGRTALIVAVYWGNRSVAKVLIEHGADPQHALNLAREIGNREMIEMLQAAIKHSI
jgi:ankyrin repeat protein